MPCYSTITIDLKIDNPNRDHVLNAAKILGWEFQESRGTIYLYTPEGYGLTIRKGKFSGTLPQEMQTKFRQAYTTSIVQTQAKAFGWNPSVVATNKLVLRRR